MRGMAIYSIKDLENLSGIKAHTLRIWEQRYGILTPSRTETNIRTYTDEELKRVLNIALLQDKGGFKISAIANMSEAEMASHILKVLSSKVVTIFFEELIDLIHEEFPMYNWKKNKGYPTKEHREAIAKYGLTKYHRLSFKQLPEQLKIDFGL